MTYLLLRAAIILGVIAFLYLWVRQPQNDPPMSSSDKKKRMWEEANKISEERKKKKEIKLAHQAHVEALIEQAHDGSLELTDEEIDDLSKKYK